MASVTRIGKKRNHDSDGEEDAEPVKSKATKKDVKKTKPKRSASDDDDGDKAAEEEDVPKTKRPKKRVKGADDDDEGAGAEGDAGGAEDDDKKPKAKKTKPVDPMKKRMAELEAKLKASTDSNEQTRLENQIKTLKSTAEFRKKLELEQEKVLVAADCSLGHQFDDLDYKKVGIASYKPPRVAPKHDTKFFNFTHEGETVGREGLQIQFEATISKVPTNSQHGDHEVKMFFKPRTPAEAQKWQDFSLHSMNLLTKRVLEVEPGGIPPTTKKYPFYAVGNPAEEDKRKFYSTKLENVPIDGIDPRDGSDLKLLPGHIKAAYIVQDKKTKQRGESRCYCPKPSSSASKPKAADAAQAAAGAEETTEAMDEFLPADVDEEGRPMLEEGNRVVVQCKYRYGYYSAKMMGFKVEIMSLRRDSRDTFGPQASKPALLQNSDYYNKKKQAGTAAAGKKTTTTSDEKVSDNASLVAKTHALPHTPLNVAPPPPQALPLGAEELLKKKREQQAMAKAELAKNAAAAVAASAAKTDKSTDKPSDKPSDKAKA